MDPATISLLISGALAAGSAGLGAYGAYATKQSNLKNASDIAQARNFILAQNIAKQNAYGNVNADIFGTNIGNYDPNTQTQNLENAQAVRSKTNVENISDADPNSVPLSDTAPAAVRSEIAKRMLTVHDAAVDRAKAAGKLGGYGDAWLTNELGNNAATRDIGVVNNYSAGRRALLGPEQDAASVAAYSAPSIWGTLLSGAGNIGGSLAGSLAGSSLNAKLNPNGTPKPTEVPAPGQPYLLSD
jgi:hypothetical protein